MSNRMIHTLYTKAVREAATEEGKKKSKELANSKKLLLATLKNSASGNESSDPSMDELLRNVDAIIKM